MLQLKYKSSCAIISTRCNVKWCKKTNKKHCIYVYMRHLIFEKYLDCLYCFFHHFFYFGTSLAAAVMQKYLCCETNKGFLFLFLYCTPNQEMQYR